MLELDADRWNSLRHAYGFASDIPAFLRQLENAPPRDDFQAEPYFTLWSSLYHQDEIYEASYAAVPHLLEAMRKDPENTNWSVAHLAARIELTRQKGRGPDVPDDLAGAYEEAIRQLPTLCFSMLSAQNERYLISIAAVALALSKGEAKLAEAYDELGIDNADDFLVWFMNR